MEKREAGGAIVFDTPDGIAFFRLATLRSGLSLEMKGIRVGRGRTCYSILKSEGYKGNRAKVLDAVTAEVDRLVAERQGDTSK